MTELSPARRVALDILLELEDTGAYARDVLDASSEVRALERRDAGLAMRLVLGVVASYGCLDDLIDAFCDKPGRMNARIRNALRIAAFELIYLGTEPRAAVSQGVELVRTRAKSAAGFANFVLRRVAENRTLYLEAGDIRDAEKRRLVALARQGGLPVWLVEEMVRSRGFTAVQDAVAAELEPAPVSAHMNPLDKTAEEELSALVGSARDVELEGEGAARHASSASTMRLPGAALGIPTARLMGTDLLRRGGVAVCDLNAQVIASAATMPGTCLEVGAGRGTKTFIMAAQAERFEMERETVALELSKKKSRLNRRRLERAGLAGAVHCVTGDGCNLDRTLAHIDEQARERRLFESVFVDAPCSGTGTMRRHPEIPWRLLPEDIEETLPELQLALLASAAERVKPGGQLVFATCSVLRQENEGVVESFLASEAGRAFGLAPVSSAPVFALPGFENVAVYVREHEDACGMFQSVPALGSYDGHFCARLVRV